ncbi:hypothetical protein CYMTET_6820 [Cymbomonas tetramitiformis]|uniref:Uncharacterized protein n=1 Tax=Cymbomonas tetramitiformis TaxID=36881 RepID=A0AAE0LHM5_9CHLO|nr:hypothetical protein CYMTET_6820 [Cymbomonas tetramitiformis]
MTRKVVRTSSLRAQVPYINNAPSAFQFFNDPDVLMSTPVEEGREKDYAEHLAYASNYSADPLRFLRASGFKDTVGYTFDSADAEADFNILLSGLRHVLFSINYIKEVTKLLDVEHDYEVYYVTINVQRAPLHDPSVRIEEGERTPSPSTSTGSPLATLVTAALLYTACVTSYIDSERRAQDLWHILADSAKVSPYTASLYLVVLRELRLGASFSFASLYLRIRTAWREEAKHAAISDRPPPPPTDGRSRHHLGTPLGRSTPTRAPTLLASPAPQCP